MNLIFVDGAKDWNQPLVYFTMKLLKRG